MEIEPEIIYSAFGALGLAIGAMWRKFSTSEEECRRELTAVWRKMAELKKYSCEHNCDWRQVMDAWPDRREAERRDGETPPSKNKDRRRNIRRADDRVHFVHPQKPPSENPLNP